MFSASMLTAMNTSSPLVIAVLLVGASCAAKLPATWRTCRINQPETDSCLKKSIQGAIDELAVKGAPSLGIYPIDPMRVNQLQLNSGTGTISLDLTFSDMDIYGFRGLRIDQAKGDFVNNRILLKVTILTDLRLEGDYSVNGRLLVVPIVGSGRCNITLGNPVAANAEINWTLQKGADGRTTAHVEKFQFDFSPKTFTLFFLDKTHGNSQIGKTLNRIANENSKEILRDLKPSIAIAFGQAFEDVANRVFAKVPYSEIFSDK